MQLHEKCEEAENRTALSEIQPRYQSAAPIHAQESKDTVAELLAVAEKENDRNKWAVVLALWIAVQGCIIGAFPRSPVGIFSLYFTLFPTIFVLGVHAIRYRKTTKALLAVNDLRMVGPLLDRLRSSSNDHRTRQVLKQALMRLLPRLKARDASQLTVKQKAELARHLNGLAIFQRDKDFQVVTLRALEQIGDAQAIPLVERIIQRKPRLSGQALVHKAAVECLPYLLQRADEDKTRNTLLRSANGFGGNTSELLLPAVGDGTDPHQLLRGDPHESVPTKLEDEC
jgi:hypothetical protein